MHRTIITLVVVAFLAPAGFPQQPAVKTIDVSKKQVLREGALQYRVLSLHTSKSALGDFLNVTMEIRNVSEKEIVKRDVWHTRLMERQLADGNGHSYESFTTTHHSPRDVLRPKWAEEHRFTFYGKLTAKDRFLYLTLPKSKEGDEVRFAIPARAFKTK